MNTRESILLEALKLFASQGYEGVSVRDIAKQIGITQAALYKHYANKQDIFNSIVNRMNDDCAKRVKLLGIPEGNVTEMVKQYEVISLNTIKKISEEQFRYWTQDEYGTFFRKMLTVEQYNNQQMSVLYQQYFTSGIISYMTSLFEQMVTEGIFRKEDAKLLALEFYSPIYMMMSFCDGEDNQEEIIGMLEKHIDQFARCHEERKR